MIRTPESAIVAIASLAVMSFVTGCSGGRSAISSSQPAYANDPAAVVVGDTGPTCAEGFRILDQDSYSAQSGGGSWGASSFRVAYMYVVSFYHPAYCNEISDDELTAAARDLVSAIPQVCSGIPRDISTRSEPFAETDIFDQWPTELTDRAIREFNSRTGGGPVGAGDSAGNVNESPSSRRYHSAYAVQAAALEFCPGD